MVAAKAGEVERITRSPPAGIRRYLVYGPDGGLVRELSRDLVEAFADAGDPGSITRLDGSALSADPARLADELGALSLFGGRRVVHLTDLMGRGRALDAVLSALKAPPADTALVVEAGDLKKSAPLRTAFERDREAYALPCYADSGATLHKLIDDEARNFGLTVAPQARALLAGQLGGDRMLSRAEIAKVCLHALDRGMVTVEDVEAVAIDAAALGLDDVADAVATGDLPALDLALARADAEALDPGVVCGAVLRHFLFLDERRAAMEGGASLDEAFAGARPPVFFKREGKVKTAMRLWSPALLRRALVRLADAARDIRLSASMGRVLLAECLYALARGVSLRGARGQG